MATRSSIPAWRIPGTEGPGGLQSTGSQSRTRLSTHTWRACHVLSRSHALRRGVDCTHCGSRLRDGSSWDWCSCPRAPHPYCPPPVSHSLFSHTETPSLSPQLRAGVLRGSSLGISEDSAVLPPRVSLTSLFTSESGPCGVCPGARWEPPPGYCPGGRCWPAVLTGDRRVLSAEWTLLQDAVCVRLTLGGVALPLSCVAVLTSVDLRTRFCPVLIKHMGGRVLGGEADSGGEHHWCSVKRGAVGSYRTPAPRRDGRGVCV